MEIGNESQKEQIKMGVRGEVVAAETERKHYPSL
jgi:hypothetical protein